MVGKKGRRGWGWIRRLPSKRYQASYVGDDLQRHTAPTTFTARMDAEHWLAKERRLIERDEWTPPATRAAAKHAKATTVGEYAKTWIKHRNIKPRTRLHYTAIFEGHIEPTLGKIALKVLTPEAIRAWHANTLVDRPTYRAHCYQLLHAICGTAVTDGLLPSNPCQIARASSSRSKRRPQILTIAELTTLADTIEPPEYRTLVLISAWCGLRWGEVSELRRRDVGAAAETITVARAVTHRGGCRVDTPKSGQSRIVVVPPHIRSDIIAHLRDHVAKPADSLLFSPVRGGCHLSDRTFRHHFNPAVKTLGRESVRIHDLRHFAGSQTARVGNLIETMSRLGHSTPSASLRYQSLVDGRDVAVADALSALAIGDTPDNGQDGTQKD
ncbi:site-specific integrase [Mycobacterium sp. 852002-10029_SCH5224772]|uniref:tyrosine-type recombinase/integrase n=1 Tax=Mycobacterium sp. 852002-10029_SCH5224772 TaxID=1834083 RepID=UPI0007FB8D82|nr:site-specific integrase [Mycobacterium sp. 852002-10029_SCH5224772]OBE98984.1 integrase [Mycobacterium sp. 852002-10029_SCH5224772]